MSYLLAPSLLSCDFANLQRECEMINSSDADWFHLDVMDGVFVPNISIGLPVIKAISRHAKKPLDIHLMIVNPEHYLEAFKDAGADILTIHYEASTHLHRNIQEIKNLGMKAGVAINPHTNTSLLSDTIHDIDLVCVMSVNPGFGGQKFIQNTYHKIFQLKELIHVKNSKALIEIDGGVDFDNYHQLIETGANVLVAGNTIFSSKEPLKAIKKLKNGN